MGGRTFERVARKKVKNKRLTSRTLRLTVGHEPVQRGRVGHAAVLHARFIFVKGDEGFWICPIKLPKLNNIKMALYRYLYC